MQESAGHLGSLRRMPWPLLPTERTHRVEREERRRLLRLARIGFLTDALAHAIAGVLAAAVALSGARPAGPATLFHAISAGFAGAILFGVLAMALAAQALWLISPATHGIGDMYPRGRAHRAGAAAIRLALAFEAARLAIAGVIGAAGDHWSVAALTAPAGRGLVGGAGLLLAVYAYRGLRHSRASLSGARSGATFGGGLRTRADWLGSAAMGARAITVGLAGVFLTTVAIAGGLDGPPGLGGALRWFAEHTIGAALIGTAALALIAYTLFLLLRAAFPPVSRRRRQAPGRSRSAPHRGSPDPDPAPPRPAD